MSDFNVFLYKTKLLTEILTLLNVWLLVHVNLQLSGNDLKSSHQEEKRSEPRAHPGIS